MSVARCKHEVSWREYLSWLAYFEQEWDRPSRTDYYLMQIALEVARMMAGKKKGRFKLNQFLLKFGTHERRRGKVDPIAAAKKAKALWAARLGLQKRDE